MEIIADTDKNYISGNVEDESLTGVESEDGAGPASWV